MAKSTGAPLGNKNAAKAKIWEQAIKRALTRLSGTTVNAGLDRLADKLVREAENGEQWAMMEVGNRIDGKPAQVIQGDPNAPLEFREILIRAVDATANRTTKEG